MHLLWIEGMQYYGAQRAAAAATALGLEITCLGVAELHFVTGGGLFDQQGRDLLALCDGVIVRSFAPYVSEVITIARLFRDAGKKVFDQALTEEGYALSKMHDYMLLAKAGLAVPYTEQHYNVEASLAAAQRIGWPVVLKGVHGARGKYVFKADDEAGFRALWQQYDDGTLMVQEFLPAEADYRILVLDGKALPYVIARRPQPGDFRTNTDHNEEAVAHPLEDFPEVVELAEQSARLLRRGFAGVDVRAGKVLEVNRRPGFKAYEAASGFDVATPVLQALLGKMR